MIHSSEMVVASPALQRHVNNTYLIGLVPAIFSLAVALNLTGKPYPLAWAIFGVSVSTNLIMYGLYELTHEPQPKMRWAKKLRANPDAWIGGSIIFIRNAFFILCFGSVWIGITLLGIPLNPLMLGSFLVALITCPIRNFCNYADYAVMPRWKFMLISFNRTFSVAAITLFVTGIISQGIKPAPGTPAASEMPIANLVLWIPAIFFIVLNVLILLDDYLRFEEKTKTH